jgi:adenylate cyclase
VLKGASGLHPFPRQRERLAEAAPSAIWEGLLNEAPMRPAASTEAWLQPTRGARIVIEGTCNLGRSPENHVVIDAAKASRFHAAIHPQDSAEFWLVDLGSRNGTFCNGRRILRPTPLSDGDRIMLADVTFTFRQLSVLSGGPASTVGGTETLVEFKDQTAWLLIVDLKDSTERSQRLSHEEWGRTLVAWIHEHQQLIEERGGQVGKYLGDGFLAYWTAERGSAARVAETLATLEERHRTGAAHFRVVVHYGTVTFGGPTALGEERMIGGDVNFIFRMERLASTLGVPCCLSAPARETLSGLVSAEPLDGEHEIKGFPGRHRFYSLAWPHG